MRPKVYHVVTRQHERGGSENVRNARRDNPLSKYLAFHSLSYGCVVPAFSRAYLSHCCKNPVNSW